MSGNSRHFPFGAEVIAETEDRALPLGFLLHVRLRQVVFEGVGEALASRAACRFETLSEAGRKTTASIQLKPKGSR